MTIDSPIDFTIEFNQTHMTVTQEPPVPPIGTDDVDDVKLTSVGPHLSALNRDDDAMLMSCWRQHATWTSHSVTRVSPGLIQPYPIFRNGFNLQKFITNSYDLRKI